MGLWSPLRRRLPWPLACASLAGLCLLIGRIFESSVGKGGIATAFFLGLLVATIPFYARRQFHCHVGGVLLIGVVGVSVTLMARHVFAVDSAVPTAFSMIIASLFAYGARADGAGERDVGGAVIDTGIVLAVVVALLVANSWLRGE